MATQTEYEARERTNFFHEMGEIQKDWGKMPVSERRQEEAEFYETMRDHPTLIAERVGWLLDGNYGQGSYLAAHDVLSRPRMNVEAWMVQTIGPLEWRVPPVAVVRAWKRLTPVQQAKLNQEVQKTIREHRAYLKEEASHKSTGRRGVSKRRVTTRRRR